MRILTLSDSRQAGMTVLGGGNDSFGNGNSLVGMVSDSGNPTYFLSVTEMAICDCFRENGLLSAQK